MPDTQVNEFRRRVKDIEAMYKSARVRALLVDRGNGLVPCIARIELLVRKPATGVVDIWSSKILRVLEGVMDYPGIDSLLDSIITRHVGLDGIQVGFDADENQRWYYRVDYRNEPTEISIADFTTLSLRGVLEQESVSQEFYTGLQDEIRLHKTLPFSSLSELTKKFFGLREGNLNLNLVDIVAPSHVKIVDLDYLGSDIQVRFRCMRETVDDMRVKAVFALSDGGFWPHSPRLRQSPIYDVPDGQVEVTKTFPVPAEAADSLGVDVTLSLKGETGLDTRHTPNLEMVNLPWFTFGLLDPTKVGILLNLSDFEMRLATLNNDRAFESLVTCLLTACGFRVAWTGGFDLSCLDMLAFGSENRPVLVCECTVGSPRHKIGLMKTAISSLSGRTRHIRFVGVVFISKTTSDPEREGALEDKVLIRDVSDIKTLVQMASEAPDERQVYSWLGVDL